jgi:glycosyltransferase involved in cell wall biosynthesis
MKILIDYNCNISYSSQYIEYLRDNFDISFNSAQFASLFLFTVINGNKVYNFVIDFADSSTINEIAYNWCNAYGKINYNLTDGKYSETAKLVKTAPSFGVKIWGKYAATYYMLMNYLKFYPDSDFKRLLSNYITQKNRLRLSEYTNSISDNKYIFFASTFWNKQNHCYEETETNNFRANFIRACKEIINIKFEGGFAPNTEKGIYTDLFMDKRVHVNEYIEKIKQSACVFNTPAVFSCNGWKLGEYFALGKAIISTPLKNDLPSPLEHGINVHFVSGEEAEMTDAIEKICSDDDYRKKLEQGAHQYWLDFGHPKNAINNLFGKVFCFEYPENAL